MYDSYHISEEGWQSILSPEGSETIRGTEHDALIFGLLLKPSDIQSLSRSKFDGFYTYFAVKKTFFKKHKNNPYSNVFYIYIG